MTLEPDTLGHNIHDKLNATGNDYAIKTIDLGEYGTSYELTKHGSDRKLLLTPIEDNLIDMILSDKTGTTVASYTLFEKAVADITLEKLAILIAISL